MSDVVMKVPIKAKTFTCTVLTVGFGKRSDSKEYKIGSGSEQFNLPSIVQKPDCGLSLNKIEKKTDSAIPADVLDSVVVIDLDKGSITV